MQDDGCGCHFLADLNLVVGGVYSVFCAVAGSLRSLSAGRDVLRTR